MATGHDVDEQGRVLPDPAWPTDKAAPDALDLIRRFCNTTNLESGADRFESTVGLTRWAEREGLRGGAVQPGDRDRLVRLREHVRAHARAHHDGHHDGVGDADLGSSLADHVATLPFSLADSDGRLEVTPRAVGLVDQTMSRVAIAIMEAQRSGVWNRFKACASCEWVFYDRSKNQAGRWCSMNACGGRAKVAAFRRRAKEADR